MLSNLLGDNVAGGHTRKTQESDPEGPLPMRQRRLSFGRETCTRTRTLSRAAPCAQGGVSGAPDGRTTVGSQTVKEAQTLTVRAGSLPYLIQCDRCVQRRLHLNHPLPLWLVSNPRTKRRQQMVSERRQQELSALGPDLPKGILCDKAKFVRSTPIHVPPHDLRVVLTGRMDLFALVDGQISAVVYVDPPPPRPDQLPFREPQLHVYSYALRNPASTKAPQAHADLQAGILSYAEQVPLPSGNSAPWPDLAATWLKCRWSDADLLHALRDILNVYKLGTATRLPAGTNCSWCQDEP